MQEEKTYTVFTHGYPNTKVQIRKGIYNPESCLYKKVIVCKPSLINDKAKDIYAKTLQLYSNTQINVGNVVMHSDGSRNHIGVVIDIQNNNALVVFCTSNNMWNKRARKATKEELNLFLLKRKTYLAPVIRPISELHNMKYSFPTFRIEQLIKEFGNYEGNLK